MLANASNKKAEPELALAQKVPIIPIRQQTVKANMQCSTIDEVLIALDGIITSSIKENNYLGIFAYVYRRTTAQVKEGIQKQLFIDNGRMEALDVTFANLYLESYHNHRQNLMVSACWKTAFDARYKQLTILQHIILGMNAHINLDLAVAAASIMEDRPIQELESDFMKVNDILAGLVEEMQRKLGNVSRLNFLIHWIAGRKDDSIIDFSMSHAREQSWRTANAFWAVSGQLKKQLILTTDDLVNQLAQRVLYPHSKLIRFVLNLIRKFEETNVEKIIKGLQL